MRVSSNSGYAPTDSDVTTVQIVALSRSSRVFELA